MEGLPPVGSNKKPCQREHGEDEEHERRAHGLVELAEAHEDVEDRRDAQERGLEAARRDARGLELGKPMLRRILFVTSSTGHTFCDLKL